MSVFFQIPVTARPIQTGNIFSATFNTPTLGKYDFGIAGNQNQNVIPIQRNSIYLIERLTIAGTIDNATYLTSISTTPLLRLGKSLTGENVYARPFPIVTFLENQEFAAWVWTDKDNDFLTMSLSGILDQVLATVGVLTLKLSVSLSVYAIEDNAYAKAVRDRLTPWIGQSLRQ